MNFNTRLIAFPKRHAIWTGVCVSLVLLVLLFDWNWFRHPLERYISGKTQRTFTISDLSVKLGWDLTPTIRIKDLYFSNADWSKEVGAMAKAEAVEFSIALRDLPEKILVPRVALTKPDLLFERLADDRKNWVLSDPSDVSPSKLRISTLSVDQGRLRYLDHGKPFDIDVIASTFDMSKQDKVKDANSAPVNNRYSTQYRFSGKYHDAAYSGNALTGEVLSFQESEVPFPIKGDLVAGTTRVSVEGTIADAANISGIDTKLRIQGQTLANLYPFLLLPLPATPPYSFSGHLILKGDKYTMDDLAGKIGSTDVSGRAAYINRKPRPLLTADLHSKLMDMADLGPVVGVQTRGTGGKPKISQAQTNTKASAAATAKAADPNHILPAGNFDGSRLQKIDAEVNLEATKLKVPVRLPFESLRASLDLKNSILKMQPLEFGFAGGIINSQITLDARQPVINADVNMNMRRIQVAQLVPDNQTFAKGAGLMGATIKLKGSGNSIADAAAKSNGHISAAVANGRLSNLLDAASGLNGGKVITLLAGGDKTIAVNCGGMAFDVKDGVGRSSLFVVDTEQTQILGEGGFNLASEQFDFKISPKPKRVGILSLRTPVRVFGSFNKPDYALEKGPLLARAGGAIAMAIVSPLAALIPLLETGPGENTICARVAKEVSGAEKQAVASAKKTPVMESVTDLKPEPTAVLAPDKAKTLSTANPPKRKASE
jgi:uncharacterized protein involved in outer membrane biogenesis